MDQARSLSDSPAQQRLIGAVRGALAGRPADVCVGLSGGPDSLALTFAAVRAGLSVEALVVDHGLQDGSHEVAEQAAASAAQLGATATVLTVTVDGQGGPEAAARTARYAALEGERAGRPVLLGHTLDDQAETVLLGLARGSGARSLAGMAPWNGPWCRPFLGIRRADTVAVCQELGLNPWHDPHNDDPRYTRVRVRHELMPTMAEVLGPGVPEALARTADQLRADADALDELAEVLLDQARVGTGLEIEVLEAAPAALRTRALRQWITDSTDSEVGSRIIDQVDALITDWHGQGPVAVAGDSQSRVAVARTGSRLIVVAAER